MRRHLDILGMFGLMFFIIAALAGCGGGGGTGTGSSTSTKTVSGVAAAGAPIIGFVWLKDSTGKQKGPNTIASDGSFSFDVSDMTAPFYLCADGSVGSTNYRFYSATTSAGTANVNPLSSLVVAAAAGVTDPASVYGSTTAASVPAAVNKAALDKAVADLKLMLAPLLTAYGATATDPIRDAYRADHTGLDAIMDVVKVEIADTSIGVVTVTDKTDGTVLTSATTTTMSSATTTYTAPSATVVSDLTAIGNMLSNLAAAINNTGRTAADIDPFFASPANYSQESGYDRTQAINDWVVYGPDSPITEFKNLTILKIDKSVVPNAYYIDGVVYLADGSFFALTGDVGEFVVVNEGTSVAPAWRFKGNGHISRVEFNPAIIKWEKADGTAQVESGFRMWIDDQGNKGIATAKITGPGLPVGGVTLTTNPDQALRLSIDIAFQTTAMPTDTRELYVMSDSVISSIPENSVYTMESYDSSSALLETRTFNIPKPPHTRSTAAGTIGFFPAISGIASHNIADAHIGGTLAFNYAKPSAASFITSSMSASLNYWDCSSNSASYHKDIPPDGASVSLISATPAWTPCAGMARVSASGPLGRRIEHMWMFQ